MKREVQRDSRKEVTVTHVRMSCRTFSDETLISEHRTKPEIRCPSVPKTKQVEVKSVLPTVCTQIT